MDAADAEAVAADLAAADSGDAGGKPGDGDKRRHVTVMDWGSQPVVQITVRHGMRENVHSLTNSLV